MRSVRCRFLMSTTVRVVVGMRAAGPAPISPLDMRAACPIPRTVFRTSNLPIADREPAETLLCCSSRGQHPRPKPARRFVDRRDQCGFHFSPNTNESVLPRRRPFRRRRQDALARSIGNFQALRLRITTPLRPGKARNPFTSMSMSFAALDTRRYSGSGCCFPFPCRDFLFAGGMKKKFSLRRRARVN